MSGVTYKQRREKKKKNTFTVGRGLIPSCSCQCQTLLAAVEKFRFFSP